MSCNVTILIGMRSQDDCLDSVRLLLQDKDSFATYNGRWSDGTKIGSCQSHTGEGVRRMLSGRRAIIGVKVIFESFLAAR